MTRRRRLLWLTAAGGLVFLAAATVAALRWQRPAAEYRPGEPVEGVTSELGRGLPSGYPRVVFTDVTRQSGIAYVHFSGTRSSQLPEDMGSGAAWGDYDNDGWVDLAIANQVGPLTLSEAEQRESPARAALYHNNRDGTFTDVTDRSGIDLRSQGMGVAWGDYDNDGRIDLVFTAFGKNTLYHNEGDGTFTDRSVRAGIDGPAGFWTGASWGDYNRDGLLDLYVTGYVKFTPTDHAGSSRRYDIENPASINPSSFRPERNLLYRNAGHGTFTEVAAAAGVTDTTGRGLSAAWADFDDDGFPDLYVANDQSDNAFFRNLGDGRFEDISHAARVADYRSAMGIAVGDWDGDGTQDLFLTHWLAQENALYSNRMIRSTQRDPKAARERLTFMDEADRFGLGQVSLDFIGWATSFIDYDNDGRLDLFVVNGSTLQQRSDPSRLVPMRNQLFWNRGRPEGFFDATTVAGSALQKESVGRGAAFADYDNDGDIDVFIVNHGARGILLRNDGGNRNNWLQVELRGTKSNRQAIGATVRVVVGERSDARQIGAQSSYLSQNSLIETYGLGGAAKADTVEVLWPSGLRDVRLGVPSNQRVIITESGASVADRASVHEFWRLYREATALRVAGRIPEAAERYARALDLNPDHEDVLYYLGGMRLELGDFDAAARTWRHLVSVNASSARTHSQLGTLYLCLEPNAPFQLDSAERHFRRAHEINKEENGPIVHLGEVALARGEPNVARRHFQTVLATHSGNGPARFYMGYLAWKSGDVAPARVATGRAPSTAAPHTQPPGVAGEGDTKRGSPVVADRTRCDAWRSLSAVDGEANRERAPVTRYRTLDSLLAIARKGRR
jgi:enediyne biosynthesis protein E4